MLLYNNTIPGSIMRSHVSMKMKKIGLSYVIIFILQIFFHITACTANAETIGPFHPWPRADRLFHSDPRWLGGDGAASIDLGEQRILWLFGDSFIAHHPPFSRQNAAVIRNSLAIQYGRNPERAKMSFLWQTSKRRPSAIFKGPTVNQWLWPVNGIRLDRHLLVVLVEVATDSNDLGFSLTGWRMALIDNPDDFPWNWRVTYPRKPTPDFGLLIGAGGLVHQGEFLYAFSPERMGAHDVFLARWPMKDIDRGLFDSPEWWVGTREFKAATESTQRPVPIFPDGQAEFSVVHLPELGRYAQFQTRGFGQAHVVMRTASKPEGPWSAPQVVYTPSIDDHRLLVYAAKAHPGLDGGRPALGYMTNSLDWDRVLSDTTIYYPRLLRNGFSEKNRGFHQGTISRGLTQRMAGP
jgi:hypothetical protein